MAGIPSTTARETTPADPVQAPHVHFTCANSRDLCGAVGESSSTNTISQGAPRQSPLESRRQFRDILFLVEGGATTDSSIIDGFSIRVRAAWIRAALPSLCAADF